MNGNKSVMANFSATPPGQYSLTTSVNTAGAGTVSPGAGSYSSGSQVTITATPAAGYQFTGFTGVDSSYGTVGYVIMNTNRSVTSDFTPTATYQLTTSVSPAGAGSITPPNGSYNSGAVVTVGATANPGYQFTGFSGALSGTTTPQNLTMNGPASVTANFTDTVTSTNLDDFRSCIGSAGLVKNCVLAQGRYRVDTPLHIQRSGINVIGGGGPSDTTLYRDSANLVQIMVADANVSDVLIENLTFDGNRYGPGLGLLILA